VREGSAFTRHNDGDLAYIHNGVESGTPVVFLHGFGDMAECWLGLINRLQLDLPIYALDAPAHGYSRVFSDVEYTNQIARRAAAFIRDLGRPVILVGHSMGALQSMHIAGDVPPFVRAMVLEDPPIAQDLAPWRDPQTIAILGGWIRKLQRLTPDEAMAKAREQHPAWDDVEFEPWVRSKHLLDTTFVGEFQIHREPMDVTLPRITCPTLVLTGDPELGAIITADNAAWASTLCSTLVFAHFPGASHDVHRDRAAAVADVVRTFLREHA
jgi:N-formylmaleamate deformylase